MISKGIKNYCNEDISLIENYEKAIADKEKTWECHHRREIETPRKKLIEIGEYFNRPANELIFLTPFEHNSLHASLKFKGNKNMLGKHHSEETKIKLAVLSKGNKNMLGKHHSDETKKKMYDSMKGRCWWNNGVKNVFSRECPEGFVKGMIKK